MKKNVKIEYLYLDLNTCSRCCGTDVVLDEVIAALRPALELAGYEIAYEKIEMATVKDAVKYEFLSSPTIRVNGQDLCGEVKENACGCCSNISGTDVTCRVFTYEGADYEVPPPGHAGRRNSPPYFCRGNSGNCAGTLYPAPESEGFLPGQNDQKCKVLLRWKFGLLLRFQSSP